MIISNYRNDAIRPIFDDKVSLALKYSILGGGNDMIIGIENMEGEICRVVTTTGMRAYMHATGKLLSIGFKNLLAGSLQEEGGFDSRFKPTKKLFNQKSTSGDKPFDPVSEVLSIIDSLENLPETERISIVLSRVGQGIFREKVIAHWKACAVTNSTTVPLLRAPHIKPWRNSTNIGRLDPFNGLLLTPNIDSAFDAGYITLDPNGKIIPSHLLNKTEASNPNISAELRINSHLLSAKHKKYLAHHRNRVYQG